MNSLGDIKFGAILVSTIESSYMKILVAFLMVLPILFGFSSDNHRPDDAGVSFKQGIIKKLGEGEKACGWVVVIEGSAFKPKNLSKAFQKANLLVNIDFDYSLSLFRCDGAEHDLQEIYVNWIETAKEQAKEESPEK